MKRIQYPKLVEAYKSLGVNRGQQLLRESIDAGEIQAESFQFSQLISSLFSETMLSDCRSGALLTKYFESDATLSSMFTNITGQIVFSKIMDAYAAETEVAASLVDTIPTQIKDGEVIPNVAEVGDEAEVISEAGAYPTAISGEDYIRTPGLEKRGMIAPLTREAALFDRTGMLMRRLADVGKFLGMNKEKRIWDAIIDNSTATTRHRINWRGTVYATYASSGGHGTVNLATSNGLADYSNVDTALQLFNKMTDPNTGEPISIVPDTILVAPDNFATANHIVNAGEVRRSTASNAIITLAPASATTPAYRVVTSRQLRARIIAAGGAATDWYLGDFRRAFAYMQAWPITVVESPPNSHDEFNSDIVQQFKASEMGAAATLDFRGSVKSTA